MVKELRNGSVNLRHKPRLFKTGSLCIRQMCRTSRSSNTDSSQSFPQCNSVLVIFRGPCSLWCVLLHTKSNSTINLCIRPMQREELSSVLSHPFASLTHANESPSPLCDDFLLYNHFVGFVAKIINTVLAWHRNHYIYNII